MIEPTLYDILQVKKDATQEELNNARKRLAKQLHPDANLRKGIDTTRQMQEMLDAYAILSDPKLREEYDATLNANPNFHLFDLKEESGTKENKNSFLYCWRQAEKLKRVVDESEPLMKRFKKKDKKLTYLSQDALSATLTLVGFQIDPIYWYPETMNWFLFRWLKDPHFSSAALIASYETHLRQDLKPSERRKLRAKAKKYEKQIRKLLKY